MKSEGTVLKLYYLGILLASFPLPRSATLLIAYLLCRYHHLMAVELKKRKREHDGETEQ